LNVHENHEGVGLIIRTTAQDAPAADAALHRNQETDVTTHKAVWSPADIAVATREARRVEDETARAKAPPARKASMIDERRQASPEPDPPTAAEPGDAPVRYARIIKSSTRAATTRRSESSARTIEAEDARAAGRGAPPERDAPTVASVFGHAPERRADSTSVPATFRRRRDAGAEGPRSIKRLMTARQVEGAAAGRAAADDMDDDMRPRRTTRLSLPSDARSRGD
jgi:hypothetical protein